MERPTAISTNQLPAASSVESSMNFGGSSLGLMAEWALWWPDEKYLLVADLHLGKDTTFRHHQIAVPIGSTESTLSRLSRLIASKQPREVIILGDFIHAASSIGEDLLRELQLFWARHEEVNFQLILGNHDRSFEMWPKSWPLDLRPSPQLRNGIWMAHAAEDLALVEPTTGSATIAGHIHPAVRFGIGNRHREKQKCFWLSDNVLTLPAFGSFTGSHIISPTSSDRVWATDGQSIIEIPARLR